MLAMFPAFDKKPPFRYYSGITKVRPMMTWVHENAAVHFDLPELPQFGAEVRARRRACHASPLTSLPPQDKALFKEQIMQRELRRAGGPTTASAPASNASARKPKKSKSKKSKKSKAKSKAQ